LFAFTNQFLFLAFPLALLFILLMLLNWKLAYNILLFTIPLSIQIEFMNGSLGTSLPDEPIMWLFLLLFAVLFAANPRLMPQWWWRNPLVLIVAAQYIWLIVAVIFSHEPLISLKFLAAKTWFLVSFFALPPLIFQSKKDFKRAFFITLIPLLATMVVIFIRHKALGLQFLKIHKAIGLLYYNHVDYSTVMSMFLPLLLVAWPLLKGKSWWLRLVLAGLILFFGAAIFFAFARAAMLAVVFAVIVALAIRIRLARWIMPCFYGFIVWLVLAAAHQNRYLNYRPVYEKTYSQKTFEDLIVSTFRGGDMSSMERVYRWIAAVRMSRDELLTGYGPNSFYYYYKPYAIASFRTYVSRNLEQSTTHNYFLLMLVEQGLPALILYAILVAVVIAQAQNTYHRFKDRFYKYCTLGVVMMFSAGFVNNFFSELLETHKVGALFYSSIALLIILSQKSKAAGAIA
jgi:O-antigen ligase